MKIQGIIGGLAVIIVGLAGYLFYSLSIDIRSVKNDLASTTANLEGKILVLQNDLATTTRNGQDLEQLVAEQQDRSDNINQTLDGIASTVGTLEKLSKTDRELLQKYSKVFFLNENYVPLQLASIDPKYVLIKDKSLQFHATVLPFLTRMLDDAASHNTSILVASAYRSFGTQASLKSSYTTSYGTGANKFSADQGYSEHQLGTAIDLSTPDVASSLTLSFDASANFGWLVNNAYRYGFILSYPKNNTYYQYEPWHWRFVGVQLATFMHRNNKNFYDLDQRQIDTYLANIFE